jgi:integrase
LTSGIFGGIFKVYSDTSKSTYLKKGVKMPKRIPPLTDNQIKNAKPKERDYKLNDGLGLYVLVTRTGGKLWRLNYRFHQKNKTLALGKYPALSLAKARSKREEARQNIADGIDPGKLRKDQKNLDEEDHNNTFQKLAEEWLMHRQDDLAPRTLEVMERRLKRNVFSVIGSTAISDLTPKLLLDEVLLPIEARGAVDLVHRIRNLISQILRYGVAKGRCDRDLTADLKGALKPIKHEHHAALDRETGTPDPIKVAGLLRAIDGFDGSIVVKCALKLHPYVATRPGELRHAQWQEIDFDNKTWSIPAGRMKMKKPHLVPLSEPALKVLHELFTVTGSGTYLFPSIRSSAKPISDNATNAALRRMGYTKDDFVSHGWRAVFRTLADEALHERLDIKDALGRAYNRTSFLKERRKLMDNWGKYLDQLKQGAKVIPLHANVEAQ